MIFHSPMYAITNRLRVNVYFLSNYLQYDTKRISTACSLIYIGLSQDFGLHVDALLHHWPHQASCCSHEALGQNECSENVPTNINKNQQ
jgi:hypothetical protein